MSMNRKYYDTGNMSRNRTEKVALYNDAGNMSMNHKYYDTGS